jgi:hypothetical protein
MINNLVMYGGGSRVKKAIKTGSLTASVVTMLLAVYAIKAAVVMYTYNSIAPKLIRNWGQDLSKFKPLSYTDALLFTILANFLFN